MRKSTLFLSIIGCAAVLCGIVFGTAKIQAQLRVHARAAEAADEKSHLIDLEKAPEWKARAYAFNLHKKTAAAIFAGATRVQVFRVSPGNDRTEKPIGSLTEIRKFDDALPYYAQGPDQSHAFAARLGAIILDPKHYPFPGQSMKQCYMEPGVVFRVWDDTKFVDVLICFQCNQMAVLEYTPNVPVTEIGGWLEARSSVGGDIDTVRPELLALAKEAMPSDHFMQSLA